MRVLAALPLLFLLLGGASTTVPAASLRVNVEGLRDHRGVLRFCLTRQPNYMRCGEDKDAVRGSVPASATRIMLDDLSPGEWSMLLIHDSNGNGKLDKRFGIPREGFGFSGNPAIGFGPPSPQQVQFALPAGASRQRVRMRYIF